MIFDLIKKADGCQARVGTIASCHGVIETPVFMPVATRASVKTLTASEVHEVGAQSIVTNSYHLLLRPGPEIIEGAGGIHQFMGWNKPIFSDSGGYQISSLPDLNQVSDRGVRFKSHIDGSNYFITPEESMRIQRSIGADFVMCFDHCTAISAPLEEIEKAAYRTIAWAEKCREFQLKSHQHLFAIVHGGKSIELRKICAEELVQMNFAGYAVGGLIREPSSVMNPVLEATIAVLPENKPRYLMGVGTPRNIVESVMRGVDIFDCVLPTRNARNGTAFTWQGKIHIKAGKYASDYSPLDPELGCSASRFSKAYIRHLLNVDEITGLTLVTMQNLAFYIDFMQKLRRSIMEGTIFDFYRKVAALYPS